eukprot:3689409-Prymnesium_polylepis.1
MKEGRHAPPRSTPSGGESMRAAQQPASHKGWDREQGAACEGRGEGAGGEGVAAVVPSRPPPLGHHDAPRSTWGCCARPRPASSAA